MPTPIPKRAIVSRVRTGVPAPLDPTSLGDGAEKLASGLRNLIVGQDEAINEIVSVYQIHLAGMTAPQRPIGNFLLLGPTGSGKTRIVEATAEILLNNRGAVLKIDCGEMQHSHEIAKLVGSPPGYLGHRETHAMLSQEALNQYHTDRCKISFVLFDEIEKASDALWNLLLGILDKGTLTLGDNRKVDFSRAFIFMTSNLGAKEMNAVLHPAMGFRSAREAADTGDEKIRASMDKSGTAAARKKFTPEFMNRLDRVVVFRLLGARELTRILDIELDRVQQRVSNAGSDMGLLTFRVSDEAKEFLLTEGTDVKYGARHLKRAIERLIVQPLSNLIASGQVVAGDALTVDHDAGSLAMTFSLAA